MPGNVEMADHPGAQRIRSNIPVSQSHHQNGFFFLQIDQCADMLCNFPGNFPVVILIRNRHIRRLQCNISALGPAHGPCSVFCLNFHHSGADIFFLIIAFIDRHTPDFHMILLKTLCCFQCQICPDSVIYLHDFFLRFFILPRKQQILFPCFPYFLQFFRNYVLTNPGRYTNIYKHVSVEMSVSVSAGDKK